MRHLKTYRLFESNNFDWFKELFIDLEDERFGITIKDSISQKLDFSKSLTLNSNSSIDILHLILMLLILLHPKLYIQQKAHHFQPFLLNDAQLL